MEDTSTIKEYVQRMKTGACRRITQQVIFNKFGLNYGKESKIEFNNPNVHWLTNRVQLNVEKYVIKDIKINGDFSVLEKSAMLKKR